MLDILRRRRDKTQQCLLKADAPRTLYVVIRRHQELQRDILPDTVLLPSVAHADPPAVNT